jgi:D-tyrosyl-tRNA(Tyr) deacylase
MRIVIQRVSAAKVVVDGLTVGSIGHGLCLFVGIAGGDTLKDADAATEKIANLRLFPDDVGKMNVSLTDVGGAVLVVSQFTLISDLRRGRRPSFTEAETPGRAAGIIDHMVDGFTSRGFETAGGEFGARMRVDLINEGPVTLVLDVSGGVVT